MKKIIARPQKGEDIGLEVDDQLTNSQAAQKAAEALGIIGRGFVWDPEPFVFPKQLVKDSQVFVILQTHG